MLKGFAFPKLTLAAILLLSCWSSYNYAADLNPPRNLANESENDRLLQHQAEQQRARQEFQVSKPEDVVLQDSQIKKGKLHFIQEEGCFPIQQVVIAPPTVAMNLSPLRNLVKEANGRCLGVQNIQMLVAALQDELAEIGYITSRITIPEQDLKSGRLILGVAPGILGEIEVLGNNRIYQRTVLPFKKGDALSIRALEQGIENIQRFPTVRTHINIVPGAQPGESDIELLIRQSKRYRFMANIDNSGSKSTGKTQGGVSLSLDNLLGFSDLIYISAGRDLHNNTWFGSHNYSYYFSIPVNYWTLAASYSKSDYSIKIQGQRTVIDYTGLSNYFSLSASRLLYRNARQKTVFNYRVIRRISNSYINKTNIPIQSRHTAAWVVGFDHRHNLGSAVLNLSVNYKQGTRWFGGKPDPEERVKRATALSKIVDFRLNLDQPFKIAQQQFVYSARVSGQLSSTPLTVLERFNIGGRWTVRGFDGEFTLSANDGFYFQNDLTWYAPAGGYSLYLGVDYGQVGGKVNNQLVGKRLAGAVLGISGNIWRFNYDTFVGIPLVKPKGFNTQKVNIGFNLSFNY